MKGFDEFYEEYGIHPWRFESIIAPIFLSMHDMQLDDEKIRELAEKGRKLNSPMVDDYCEMFKENMEEDDSSAASVYIAYRIFEALKKDKEAK